MELVTQAEALQIFDELKQSDIKKYVTLGLQAESLESATGIEVTAVIGRIVSSRNIGADGVIKGVSNRDMAKTHNVSTSAVHIALEQLGFAKNKQVTIEGFEYVNGVGVKTVDFYTDIPLFYYTDEGSLYWNDLHEKFKEIWELILNEKVGEAPVRDSEYNKQFKTRTPAMPKGYMKMLQFNKIDIMLDDMPIRRIAL